MSYNIKLKDICYLNLTKKNKIIFLDLFPNESKNIRNSIEKNISFYSKIKPIYLNYSLKRKEYSYHLIGYFSNYK